MFPNNARGAKQPILQTVFLTTTGLQNWSCPSSVSEIAQVDCYGGGNSFGGGGGFSRKFNVAVAPGGSIPYTIGPGGANTVTWFKSNTTVAAGNSSASGIGDLKYSGGGGGDQGGGGGCAGPNGNGLSGSGVNGGAPNAGVGGGVGGTSNGSYPTSSATRSNVYNNSTYGPGGGGAGSSGFPASGGANYGGGGGFEDSPDPNNGPPAQGLIVLQYYE